MRIRIIYFQIGLLVLASYLFFSGDRGATDQGVAWACLLMMVLLAFIAKPGHSVAEMREAVRLHGSPAQKFVLKYLLVIYLASQFLTSIIIAFWPSATH